ncbi:MAG: lactonase family protein [Candidatus Dormibacteraeota bacterium]|nr:lactonase family protein [Candidatus Dormibacteraeota bacterium]
MPDSQIAALLVGTYTPPQGRGEGVALIELDTEHGTLSRKAVTATPSNPSFIALSPAATHAYAVSEVISEGGQASGALVSLALQDGAATVSGSVETASTEPCHVSVSPDGRHAVVANYGGGAVSVIALEPDGPVRDRTDLVQHRGSSVDPDRQAGPHAHSATFDARGERVLVCDLGLDRVVFYRLDGDGGRLVPLPALDIPTPAGTGPRHLDFDPDGQRLYVLGELNSTLVVYAHDPASGETEQLQVASTLGDAVPERRNHPADVHVHPTGRFVYASNRGLDSIAIFGIDERDGRVELLANHPGGGRVPRNFAIDPSGHLLLCANQQTDTIVPFWIDRATGLLSQAAQPLGVGSPVCLRFLRS